MSVSSRDTIGDSKIEHGFLNEVKKDMRGEGFEPANDFRADLESASVGHLDTLAKSACIYLRDVHMKVCTLEKKEYLVYHSEFQLRINRQRHAELTETYLYKYIIYVYPL